jgi:hypothetical protein
MCLARILRPEGAKKESLAQGLPWVSQQKVLCPEGARNAHGIRSKVRSPFSPYSMALQANSGRKLTQGYAFLATSGRGPSGQRTGAKHV